ncbi:MAG: transposase [Candidatus Riflebacteria bacterium]|jgi:transposase|nr:transposase [Candidatus Riflebacteria bacterium]
MNKRNSHSPEYKMKAVLELLRGEETLSQIAQRFEVHPNMLSRWHKEFLERAPELFKRGQTDAEKALKEERDRSQHLEKLVGQLTYEVDWLKKKSAQLGIKAGKA